MNLLFPWSLIFISLFFPSFSNIFWAVHGQVSNVIIVDKEGKGDFDSVQAAIDSVLPNNDNWVQICINPGIYLEKVQIPENKPYIILQGKSRENTTISCDGHERTDLSATLSSFADNFIAIGITFENSFDLPKQSSFDTKDEVFILQALSARIYGDKSAFFDCGFKGVQDTLWDVQGRHYYKSCYIEGAIDFIWGYGQSVFEECQVFANVGLVPQINEGYITAQGRLAENEANGFVFINSSVAGSGPALLGRAYGPFSRVIFYKTWMDSIVVPRGWDQWNFTGVENNFMYAELDCRGPGSSTDDRVPWEKKFDEDQIQEYLVSSFINKDQWIENIPGYRSELSTLKL